MASSSRWTIIAGLTENASDMGLYIESPEGGLLAQPRTLGTWWFVVLDPMAPPAEILLGTVMGMVNDATITGLLARTITAEADRTFTVRRTADELGCAYGDTGAETPEALSEQAGQEKLITELASFIVYLPGME